MFQRHIFLAFAFALWAILSSPEAAPRALAQPNGLASDAAVTFTVDDRLDYPDATASDNQCLSTQGTCTLRAAIQQANARQGKTKIVLPTPSHSPPLPDAYEIGGTPREDNAATGDLDIHGRVHLVGDGVTPVMQIAGFNRIFDIYGSDVTFEKMVIQYGYGDSNPGHDTTGAGIRVNVGATLKMTKGSLSHHNNTNDGGAVAVYGNFRATKVTIQENQGNRGGAIYNVGTTRLKKSIVRNNSALKGGGIYNESALTLQSSTVQDNQSVDNGGGIFSFGTMALIRTTVKSNSGDRGGGMFLAGGTTDARESALHDNRANDGGGIFVDGGEFNLNNSTVSKNSQSGIVADGGATYLASVTVAFNLARGIDNRSASALSIKNSLLAKNQTDCKGVIDSDHYNFVGDLNNCNFVEVIPTSIFNQNPRLGALRNNGGPTLTHALKPNSLAIDHGNGDGCVSTKGDNLGRDQRGRAREDGNGNGIVRCDIGAYEFKP